MGQPRSLSHPEERKKLWHAWVLLLLRGERSVNIWLHNCQRLRHGWAGLLGDDFGHHSGLTHRWYDQLGWRTTWSGQKAGIHHDGEGLIWTLGEAFPIGGTAYWKHHICTCFPPTHPTNECFQLGWTLLTISCRKTGIQAYFGGQAVTLILGAVIPQFQQLQNTLPERFAGLASPCPQSSHG